MVKHLFVRIVLVLLTINCTPVLLKAQIGLVSSVSQLDFTTDGGDRIVTISKVNGTVSAARIINDGIPAPEFSVVTGIKRENELPVSISAEKNGRAGLAYKLELFINKSWVPVPMTINIIRKAQRDFLSNRIDVTDNKKVGIEKSSIAIITEAENSSANRLRVSVLKNRINKTVVIGQQAQNIKVPEIKDWFPKDTGAIGGTFVLIGKNLDSVLKLTLGGKLLPVIRRVKNSSFEAIIVQLPSEAATGTINVTYPGLIGVKKAELTMPVNNDFVLVDQFSSLWPTAKATVINISPAPNFEGRPHALKQYTYSILYEYIPGNIVKDYTWVVGSRIADPVTPNNLASTFRPSSDFGMGVVGEAFSGSGFQDASGGNFITGNMFIGTITGTIHSTQNGYGGREIAVMSELIQTQISSYLSTNSLALQIIKSKVSARFEYNTPQYYTISNTYELKDILEFNKFYSKGKTEGVSTGQSDVAVGIVKANNDLAFRIASGPIGTEALWISTPFIMSDGWKVNRFNWKESRQFPGDVGKAFAIQNYLGSLYLELFGNFTRDLEGCRNYKVYRPIAKTAYSSLMGEETASDFQFSYVIENANESLTCNPYMRADPNGYPGHTDRQNIKGATVNLKANPTLTNDHRVTLTLESIELYGPRGANSSAAFADIIKYEPMLRPLSGHIIGIVYPEFFKIN